MAKRATKGSAKKRTTTTRATKIGGGANLSITLGCAGQNCVPDQDPFHMSPGDTVDLTAPRNDVKLHFTRRNSPFVSGTNPFTVRRGTTRTEVVKPQASGNYVFHLTCSNPGCGNLSSDPSMIVP
jgi:hypothetical protein